MRYTSTRRMEREAKKLASELNSQDIFGTKCWYSSASIFEEPATKVFIGTNPGGDRASQELDLRKGYLELPYNKADYSAWLDEGWPDNGPKHQEAVVSTFRSMYGGTWEKQMRGTASFNVVPFRSPSVAKLSPQAWRMGTDWSREVLEHLSPSLVICNGNSRSKSPWSVLHGFYSVEDSPDIPIGATGSTASIKRGVIVSGSLHGCQISGLPSLSRFGWPELYRKLSNLKPFP